MVLLGFFVIRVLAAGVAELRELEAASGRLLVLRRGVVPVLALGALQGDDLAHGVSPLSFGQPLRLASSSRSVKWNRSTRRDAGLRCLQPIFLIVAEEERSGHARPIYYPRKQAGAPVTRATL